VYARLISLTLPLTYAGMVGPVGGKKGGRERVGGGGEEREKGERKESERGERERVMMK
jgi:hypothetical protein